MRYLFLTPCLVLVAAFSFSQNIQRLDNSVISADALSKKIRYLMDTAHVHGMDLAIFNKNKAVFKKAFGYKNFANKEPLVTSANVYGASLSKSVFAVLVMKLVEEGVLDLDKPLQEYLDKPIYEYTPKTKWHDHYESLKTDSLYHTITARMCLDHTTGFSNWRWDEPDQKLRVNLRPGSRYSYSGEGLTFLQFVIEKKLGKSLDELMQEKIFTPLKMRHSAYHWEPRFEQDYALGHNQAGKAYEKDKDNEPRSASTLETTLDDLTLFMEGLLQHKIISAGTVDLMWSPQIRLRSVEQMGPLSRKDTTGYDPIQLSYGLGWGLLRSPYGWGAFKEGHGDGFQHYMIFFPAKQTGILIMTNSDNGESIFKELLEITIGDKYTPWAWQRYIPYNYGK